MNVDEMKKLEEMTELVGCFLLEFCNVNRIAEESLKDHVNVVSSPEDSSILVVNVDDQRDVKFGVTLDDKIETFGEYTEQKELYTETSLMEHKLCA